MLPRYTEVFEAIWSHPTAFDQQLHHAKEEKSEDDGVGANVGDNCGCTTGGRNLVMNGCINS